MPLRTTLRAVVLAVLLASFFWTVYSIYNSEDSQWDFRTYYQGAIAYGGGGDPYFESGYVYPPVYLPPLTAAASRLSYNQAATIYLAAKVVCFAFLLGIWRHLFASHLPIEVFGLFCWIGLNATAYQDFNTGNISIFEATSIFLAFSFLLNGRPAVFTCLIVAAATFKLAPIFFLSLLLLHPRRHVAPFMLGVFLFIGFGIINLALFGELSQSFVQAASTRAEERGLVNPSSLALIHDAVSLLMNGEANDKIRAIAYVLYVVLVVSVCLTSWEALRKHAPLMEGETSRDRARYLMAFSLVVFALIAPRMKDYTYTLVIPAILLAISRLPITLPYWWPVVPLFMIGPHSGPPPFHYAAKLLFTYFPLFVTGFFWLQYLRYFRLAAADTSPQAIEVQHFNQSLS